MVKITFAGPVKVMWTNFDGSEDREIDDPQILQKFDGSIYMDYESKNKFPVELSQYLGDGEDTKHLADIGITGGILRYEYGREKQQLWILMEYYSPRKLSEEELQCLYHFTEGQWYDGAGSNFAGELADKNNGVAPLGHPLSVYLFEDGDD